jgi:hypothetical protein
LSQSLQMPAQNHPAKMNSEVFDSWKLLVTLTC